MGGKGGKKDIGYEEEAKEGKCMCHSEITVVCVQGGGEPTWGELSLSLRGKSIKRNDATVQKGVKVVRTEKHLNGRGQRHE